MVSTPCWSLSIICMFHDAPLRTFICPLRVSHLVLVIVQAWRRGGSRDEKTVQGKLREGGETKSTKKEKQRERGCPWARLVLSLLGPPSARDRDYLPLCISLV